MSSPPFFIFFVLYYGCIINVGDGFPVPRWVSRPKMGFLSNLLSVINLSQLFKLLSKLRRIFAAL